MDPYLGQIEYYPYSFQIHGWAFADGRKMSISQNTPLFALIGTYYGGDGQSYFNLPDLRKFKNPGNEYHVGEIMADGSPYLKAQISLAGIFPSRD
jgi:microcystin-dependent protein